MNQDVMLQVQDLSTHFIFREGQLKALNGVSVSLKRGQILGVVGESGSGKTVLALSIMGLIPFPGKVISGQVMFQGRDLLGLDLEAMRKIRGKEIAMVFQDATAGLNPVMQVGTQVEEMITTHLPISKKAAREETMAAMKDAGLPEPKRVYARYPYELSGGMCQRVMLAMAMILQPKVLIADEPTSSLDVTMQAQIMAKIREMRDKNGTSVILITHDLGLVAQMADEVAVMYAGSLMEYAKTPRIFKRPTNPYTWSLLQTITRIDQPDRPLRQVPGNMPNLMNLPDKCSFLSRCPKARNECRLQGRPPLDEVETNHLVACYNKMYYQD